MSTSADTRPIPPARFAAALKDLSLAMLHLKVLEIRNSIAHLQYSNDQLRPFAQGTETALGDSSSPSSSAAAAVGAPDQDCVDAIKENDAVIDRMAERVALVRAEVEDRGLSWDEFQSRDEVESKKDEGDVAPAPQTNGNGVPVRDATTTTTTAASHDRNPWTDGTFQMGTIRNGQLHMDPPPTRRPQAGGGGTVSDEQLRRAVEERMRELGGDEDDNDGGMHL